ncbi:helix-turn-helix domain-containing protein [Lonsdalea quercina]|uniref:helix-turn-helix domain-containing protein n=1 Tax=Lonsdalea quercina TaxID=71657 RepID=UPI003974D91D
MKTTNAQRKTNIIKNIEYLMRTRGETKASFSNRTGVTRTTIYKILDGRVNNVQQSTVNRISDFFGLSCEEIEDYDLEKIEQINNTLSYEGNKNPAAIPIIPQSDLLASQDKKIGQLVIQYPLTYFFGEESNILAMRVESTISDQFSPNDVIIIKRPPALVVDTPLLCYSQAEGFIIQPSEGSISFERKRSSNIVLLGYIIEERL